MALGHKNIKNNAIRRVYKFSKEMFDYTDQDKINRIVPFLDSNHVYVKYWGAVIALSYNLIVEKAIRERYKKVFNYCCIGR